MTVNLKSRGTCAVCDRYVGITAIAHLARAHRSWQRNAATGEKEFKKCPGSNKPVIGNEIARQSTWGELTGSNAGAQRLAREAK